jgi:hypothetical protein
LPLAKIIIFPFPVMSAVAAFPFLFLVDGVAEAVDLETVDLVAALFLVGVAEVVVLVAAAYLASF